MKTHLPTLLALAAALSSNAVAGGNTGPARRCVQLESVQEAIKNNKPNQFVVPAASGEAGRGVITTATDSFPCDKALKNYIVRRIKGSWGRADSFDWRNHEIMNAWTEDDLDQQVRILSALDEVYFKVDTFALDVLDEADAVVKAAVDSGVVTKNNSGESFAALKDSGQCAQWLTDEMAYTVAPALAADNPKKLLNAGKIGKLNTAYQRAVIAMSDELKRLSSVNEIMRKAGVKGVTVDFSPGSSVERPLPPAPNDESTKYQLALHYITDPLIVSASDTEEHGTAALSSLDYGLRNLIALRLHAVDVVLTAFKPSPSGTPAHPAPEQPRDSAAAAPPSKTSQEPKTDIAAAVLAKLKADPDFHGLDALFDAQIEREKDGDEKARKWLHQPQVITAQRQRDQMIAAAGKVGVENGKFYYYKGGKKFVATKVDAAKLADSAYIDSVVAPGVVSEIIKGSGFRAKTLGVIQALLGQGSPSAPAAPEAVPAAEKALDVIIKATPVSWLGDPNQHMASYLSKAQEGAAASAAQAALHRQEITRLAQQAKAAQQIRCDELLRVSGARDAAQVEAAGCGKSIETAYKAAVALSPTDDDVGRQQKTMMEEAERLMLQAYVEGIDASLTTLRGKYTTPPDGDKIDLAYFDRFWGADSRKPSSKPKKSKTSMDLCREALWPSPEKPPVDPTVENIDNLCVRGLYGELTSKAGKVVKKDAK